MGGLPVSEPCVTDVMVAAAHLVPFSLGSFQGLSGLPADPELQQMRSLAKAGDQVTHADLPSHGPHEVIR